MTHDLFKTVLDDLAVQLDQVVITELQDGTFYAEVELAREGGACAISSRPSDAIALAVRDTRTRCRSSSRRPCSTRPACSSRPREDEEQIEQFREFLEQVSPEDFAE